MSNVNKKWISKSDYTKYEGKLFDFDYLFNYSGLKDEKVDKEDMGSADILKKCIMIEQI